jgi:hypothetical protein
MIPVILDPAERLAFYITHDQVVDADAAQAEDADLWEAAVAEAARRRCDPEDLLALWQDDVDEPADFDDHDSEHDPRDCQGILDELGMREVPLGYLSRCNPPTPYTDEP